MNIQSTGTVLAAIQRFNQGFQVDREIIIAWHELLEPYNLDDCLEAVAEHYRTSTDWIMPAHIIDRVRVVQRRRIGKVTHSISLNPADAEAASQSGTVSERTKQLRTLIGNGVVDNTQYHAYQAGNVTLDALSTETPKAITR